MQRRPSGQGRSTTDDRSQSRALSKLRTPVSLSESTNGRCTSQAAVYFALCRRSGVGRVASAPSNRSFDWRKGTLLRRPIWLQCTHGRRRVRYGSLTERASTQMIKLTDERDRAVRSVGARRREDPQPADGNGGARAKSRVQDDNRGHAIHWRNRPRIPRAIHQALGMPASPHEQRSDARTVPSPRRRSTGPFSESRFAMKHFCRSTVVRSAFVASLAIAVGIGSLCAPEHAWSTQINGKMNRPADTHPNRDAANLGRGAPAGADAGRYPAHHDYREPGHPPIRRHSPHHAVRDGPLLAHRDTRATGQGGRAVQAVAYPHVFWRARRWSTRIRNSSTRLRPPGRAAPTPWCARSRQAKTVKCRSTTGCTNHRRVGASMT